MSAENIPPLIALLNAYSPLEEVGTVIAPILTGSEGEAIQFDDQGDVSADAPEVFTQPLTDEHLHGFHYLLYSTMRDVLAHTVETGRVEHSEDLEVAGSAGWKEETFTGTLEIGKGEADAKSYEVEATRWQCGDAMLPVSLSALGNDGTVLEAELEGSVARYVLGWEFGASCAVQHGECNYEEETLHTGGYNISLGLDALKDFLGCAQDASLGEVAFLLGMHLQLQSASPKTDFAGGWQILATNKEWYPVTFPFPQEKQEKPIMIWPGLPSEAMLDNDQIQLRTSRKADEALEGNFPLLQIDLHGNTGNDAANTVSISFTRPEGDDLVPLPPFLRGLWDLAKWDSLAKGGLTKKLRELRQANGATAQMLFAKGERAWEVTLEKTGGGGIAIKPQESALRKEIEAGKKLYAQGKYEESAEILRAVFQGAVQVRDAVSFTEAALLLADFDEDNSFQVLQYSFAAWSYLSTTPDSPQKMTTAIKIATTFEFMGSFEGAKDFYLQALDIATRASDVFTQARIHLGLGHVYFSLRRLRDAEREFQLALNEAQKVAGNRDDEKLLMLIDASLMLGRLYLLNNKVPLSRMKFQTALDLANTLHGPRPFMVRAYLGLAQGYLMEGRLDDAELYLMEAEDYADEHGNPLDPRSAYYAPQLGIFRTRLALIQGNSDEAVKQAKKTYDAGRIFDGQRDDSEYSPEIYENERDRCNTVLYYAIALNHAGVLNNNQRSMREARDFFEQLIRRLNSENSCLHENECAEILVRVQLEYAMALWQQKSRVPNLQAEKTSELMTSGMEKWESLAAGDVLFLKDPLGVILSEMASQGIEAANEWLQKNNHGYFVPRTPVETYD